MKVGPLRSLHSVTTLLDEISLKPVQLARDPQVASLKIWHQVLLAALLYEFAAIPFIITFQPNIPLSENPTAIVFYVCEALFFLDFYVKLTTGFYQDGNLVYDLQQSRKKYLKSLEFAIDVLSVIPFGTIRVQLPVSVMVLEVHKILRVYRYPRYLSNVDDLYIRHFELLKLTKLLVGVVLLSHYIACIRFSFGYDEHGTNHWLPSPPEHSATTQTQYLMSMFWAFGLLTGLFEGELPHTINEFFFTIAVAICGFSVFTYLCATFFLISKCEASNSEVAEARIAQLKHILTFHRVPENVRDPIIEYLRHYHTGTDIIDREVTKLLCPSIGKDVQVELLREVVAKIPVFSDCRPEFIEVLTSLLERISLPAQCTLFSIGDPGDAMYIIHAGVLDILGRKAKIRELRKNDYVGELSLFSSFPRSATVVTSTYCVLYKLSRFHTELVLDNHPTAAYGIKKVVAAIIEKTQEKSSLSNPTSVTAVRPAIKPRRGSTEDPNTPPQLELWTGMAGPRKKSSLVTPIPDLEDTVTVHRPPKLLQRILSMKKKRVSDAMKDVYDGFTAPRVAVVVPKPWWTYFLLEQALDCDDSLRIAWVLTLQLVLIFNWCMIPLQLSFPIFNEANWIIYVLNGVADVILWVDIYGNFNLSYMQASEKIRDTAKCAERYLLSAFLLDFLCVLPYEALAPSGRYCLARIPKLFRVWRVSGHLHEIDQLYPLRSSHRLLLFAVLLFLLIHIGTCLYFSFTSVVGFCEEEEGWLLYHDVELHRVNASHFQGYNNTLYALDDPELQRISTMQYLRSFYFATHKFTGLGKGVEPENDIEYVVALLFMFSGFVITAIVVDNVQKRFTASAHEEKEFFAVRSRIQGFLRHQNATFAIHHRVNIFLEFWRASHRGTSINELLSELPVSFKQEVLRSIYLPVLQTLALLTGVRNFLKELEDALVENAVMMLFGQGEFIYHVGDNARGLYFSLEGKISLESSGVRTKVSRGGYFGAQVLSIDTMQTGYTENAIAESGCVVIFLSRDALHKLYSAFPPLPSELIQLEKKILRTKLAKSAFSSQELQKIVRASPYKWRAIDPESKYVIIWETWLAVAMTIQWIHVLVNICFGKLAEDSRTTDGVTVALEVFFTVDIYVRLCLGYREFGNKIMDLKLIRRRYLHSWYFVVDMIALLPLFMLNWLPFIRRREIFNLNKVVRLVKVPNQLRALEQRYVKFTSELRLMKLVYYTFLATHVLGCVYFENASHASGLHNLTTEETMKTNFGENSWSLPKSLENANILYQYFASNFWAFGIMSASNTGEPPQTIPQCLLTILTLLIGFFLFAYVIGNFSDIIELANAEHREFHTKMGSIRRLLAHFKLRVGLQNKIKTILFFKRFHSITQEEILERYLPPTLTTDIRLQNLNPMIEKVPFLKDMNVSITRMLVAQFQQVLMLKDEHVYMYGDKGTNMFFVFTGILTIFAPKCKDTLNHSLISDGRHEYHDRGKAFQKVTDIKAGDFFGDDALFTDTPRTSSVRSKSSCILYSLSRYSLEMVFELFPDWKAQVLQTVKVQQKELKQRESSGQNLVRSFNSNPVLKRVDSSPLPTQNLVQDAFVPPKRQWFKSFSTVLEAQSPLHIMWLRVVTACTFYVAFMLPSCVAFEACRSWDGLSLGANTLEVLCFLVFLVDVWINLRLKETELAMELYEVNLQEAYRHRRLWVDILAALPVQYIFTFVSSPADIAWLGVNRCVKVLNVGYYFNEIHRQSVLYEWARLQTISSFYILVIYWGACAYLLFADHVGYSAEWNAWLPSTELEIEDDSPLSVLYLRLLRGVFFAVTAFIKKGRTFMPKEEGFIFAIIVCFCGLMVMAFVIGEIASLFISSIDNEVNYRKNHIAVEHTMARWKVSANLNARVHVFLSNLWSSHRGVLYQEVFNTLPAQNRLETVLHIVDLPLQALIFQVFRPLALGDGPSLTRITHAIADQLRFDSYPSGELVLQEGRMPEGLFFVVSGQLVATTKERGVGLPIAQYMRGDYFGERGILTHSMSTISVQTQMPCDLFLLSTNSLMSILTGDEFFSIVQITVEGLFQTLQRQQKKSGGRTPFPMPPFAWEQQLRKILNRQRLKWALKSSDSDSKPASKGEMLWNKLLTAVLDTSDAPLACVQLFRPYLEMAGPKCELFDRNPPQRRVVVAPVNVRKTPVAQLKTLVRHIGDVAVNTSSRMVPSFKGSSISRLSSQSRRSSVSRRLRSTRLFTERSQRVQEPTSGQGD
ncbi:Cyclic nucleotide-gated channel rod photoreceptor subunit alpha [Phytophthora citrophthora]|uniref:Cyclic nucleotide-gated channel rod photoreceptor subunit alpha n=1 Tax=Phytophthora citrophthora TaxID=4793 RepID=A0AAD9LB79_9STRA|nr:Cyclic nucleotide-gated channel rod photoreceptor subunit alpha [Phytophthora citrophthora]